MAENQMMQVKEESKGLSPVNINNLVISKLEREVLALGDTDSFLRYTQRLDVKAVIWNERYLVAATDDRRMILAYKPEIEPTTQMFFMREERHRSRDDEGDKVRVWEGEYSPIEFTKGNLIKFLKAHAVGADENLIKAIKNMKVIDKIESHESLIDLGTGDFDDNNVRTVEEETSITNLPNKFTLRMAITSTYSADLMFEAKVIRSQSDSYNNPNKGKRVIQLRVTNAREVMRGLMTAILDQLPQNVDKFYGKMSLKASD